MEKDTNQIHPQDGNQVVIGSITGNVNIQNSSDTDLLKAIVKADVERDKMTVVFLNDIKAYADKWYQLSLEINNKKGKSKRQKGSKN